MSPHSFPINPKPKEESSTLITSTIKGSPDLIYKPDYSGLASRPESLLAVSVSNDADEGGATCQVRVGVRKASATGSDWRPIMSPVLAPGQAAAWRSSGAYTILAGDELVAISTVPGIAILTWELGAG